MGINKILYIYIRILWESDLNKKWPAPKIWYI